MTYVGEGWCSGLRVGTSDLKVGASRPSPCWHRVVSLDKKLYLTLSFSTQVYKMGTGDILLGVTLRWTSIPSSGEWQYSQLLHATETGISSGRVCVLGSCATLPLPLLCNVLGVGVTLAVLAAKRPCLSGLAVSTSMWWCMRLGMLLGSGMNKVDQTEIVTFRCKSRTYYLVSYLFIITRNWKKPPSFMHQRERFEMCGSSCPLPPRRKVLLGQFSHYFVGKPLIAGGVFLFRQFSTIRDYYFFISLCKFRNKRKLLIKFYQLLQYSSWKLHLRITPLYFNTPTV